MRALVTGGAGFIGANLVQALLKQGYDVVVLDDLSTGVQARLASVGVQKFVHGTVVELRTLRPLMAGVDLVIHAAARNIGQSIADPADDGYVNAIGTLHVLVAAREAGVKRVVYTSSASVYGNARRLPAHEDDPTNILSPYSASKLAGEHFCQAFYESYDLPVTIVRYSNVYGRFQDVANPYCGVVAKFFASAMRGELIKIHGDGEQTRDFTYVADVVDATLKAAQSSRAIGRLYNIGTGIETSVNTLAKKIARMVSTAGGLTSSPSRDIDNIRRRVLHIDRARHDLRWAPETRLDDGLGATYQWIRNG